MLKDVVELHDKVRKVLEFEEYVCTRLASLESQMKEIVIRSKIEKPQCPHCFEDMSFNTKIAQCLSGHFVCWSCKEKDSRDCGLCGQPVNGRCFGMESFLDELFR